MIMSIKLSDSNACCSGSCLSPFSPSPSEFVLADSWTFFLCLTIFLFALKILPQHHTWHLYGKSCVYPTSFGWGMQLAWLHNDQMHTSTWHFLPFCALVWCDPQDKLSQWFCMGKHHNGTGYWSHFLNLLGVCICDSTASSHFGRFCHILHISKSCQLLLWTVFWWRRIDEKASFLPQSEQEVLRSIALAVFNIWIKFVAILLPV